MLSFQNLRGVLRYQEPLSQHTTWRIGGPAACFYTPADVDDLLNFLQQLPADEPLLWLGLGSNLLVRDGGWPGTVIATAGLNRLEMTHPSGWYVEAGVPCAKLARQTVRAGLMGGEFFAGIPGSVGGALAMNAGAFGGETWSLVTRVLTLDRHGQRRERPPSDYQIGYRAVQGPPEERFLAAWLQFQPGPVEQVTAGAARIKTLLQQRKLSQPTGLPSCGSVFRNPTPWFAARLIEEAGLKGLSIGGAQISEKHANFIINTGQARAVEVEALIAQIITTIHARYGVQLQPEVRIVGVA